MSAILTYQKPAHMHYGLLLICVLFLVYDNYYVPLSVRLFDVLGGLLLVIMAASGRLRLRNRESCRVAGFSLSVLVTGVIVLAVAQGAFIQKSFSVIPFLIGLMVYFLLRRSAVFEENADRILLTLIWLASITLILQYVVFKLTGYMFSMLVFDDGTGLRSAFGSVADRPTGLYVEPSSHASAMIMLIWPYVMRTKRISVPVVLGCISLLLSQSFLAIVYLFTFVIAFGLYGPLGLGGKGSSRLKFLVNATLVMSAMFIVLTIPGNTFEVTVVQRFEILKLAADGQVIEGSFTDRVGPLSDGGFVTGFMQGRNLFQALFGKGVSSEHFQDEGGINTISWLLTSFGIIGSIILIAYLVSLLGFNAFGLTFIALMMLPYPLASYNFQWMLLAILAVQKRRRAV